jgi:isopenicillin N synthase-like dioxygenase
MGIVPTIDIAAWSTGGTAVRDGIAAEVAAACRTVGFLEVAGHGLSSAVMDALQAVSDQLFSLPEADKLALRPARPDINRGYAARGAESLGYSLGHERPADLFEAFNVGVEISDGDPAFFPANIWPAIPHFRAAVGAYLDEVRSLARRIEDIIERALGLPGDFFVTRADRSVDVLRMNRYERHPDDPDPLPGQMRMGGHTDYGMFTILLADPVPGLQILAADDQWHDVTPRPGNVVINLGDAMAIWTNDTWRSTLHRVVPARATDEGPALRRSWAFFHDGNVDMVLECLPPFVTPERPARYTPTTLRDHLAGKVISARARQPSTTTQTLAGRRPSG